MKSVYLIAIMLSFVSTSLINIYAYEDFAPIGATWYFSKNAEPQNYMGKGNPYAYVKYESVKDSVIKDTVYRVVASESDTLLFYNDRGKVYYRYRDRLWLIYDFTAKEGDTISLDYLSYRMMDTQIMVYDTFYEMKCEVIRVSEIDLQYYAPYKIKNFEIKILPREDLPEYGLYQNLYAGGDSTYYYKERVGVDGFYFLPYIDNFIRIPEEIFYYPQLRCYSDSIFNYNYPFWDFPCDYEGNSSGIKESVSQEESVQVNIEQNKINISAINNDIEDISLYLYSTEGGLVLRKKLTHYHEILDVSHIVAGFYNLIIYKGSKSVYNAKIMIQ